MKAKVNHLYEQNEDISTGAVAYREKGNTTVGRATYLCIRCSIVYGQVERSRDGGISVARGSFDGSGSVARGSLDSVALLRLRESAQLHVRIAASELLMVWMVAMASLNLVMAAVVLMAAAVSMTLLKLQDTTQLKVRTVASTLHFVRTGSLASLMVVMTAVVLRAAAVLMTLLKLWNHAVEGVNVTIGVAHGADGGIGVAHSSDDSCRVEGSSSVDDASEAMRNQLKVRTVALHWRCLWCRRGHWSRSCW